MKNNEQIEKNFSHVIQSGPALARYERLSEAVKVLANDIENLCPNCREKSLAITNLEQAVMWAKAAIARE